MQKVTILAPKSSRTFMEIGNEMQYHKIVTNSELIYEDGSIWSTLISRQRYTVIPITTVRGPLIYIETRMPR